ncbi:FxSxx-COOH system tetratricopeptide repeat protein [Actinocorallia longicatena]|uniref:FxSxx-COOH system tetratricopeptide repeat protein n=2 Tax=Actinocorallia longicatena TaxID=111803 RepID=A0ABP6Q1J7_9ACTN
MAVANIALLLGAAGHRVLVVRLDPSAQDLRALLAPLFARPVRRGGADLPLDFATAGALPALGDLVVPILTGADGTVDLLEAAGAAGAEEPGSAPPRIDHSAFIRALRKSFLSSGYDYVVVDAPPGSSELVSAILADLIDILVLLYPLDSRTIQRIERVAYHLRNTAARDIRFLPVAAPAQEHRKQTEQANLQLARRRFSWALEDVAETDEEDYWQKAILPPHAEHPDDTTLAVLLDPPGAGTVSCYRRLTELVLRAPLTGEFGESLRDRYKIALGLGDQPEPDRTFGLVYAPIDRVWADWVAAELVRMGLRVRLPANGRFGPDDVLVVIGSADPSPPLLGAAPSGGSVFPPLVLGVKVGNGASFGPSEPDLLVDLRGLGEADASARLRERILGAPGGEPPAEQPGGPSVRFPRRRPALLRIPPRDPAFVGRDVDLERLRDGLRRTPAPDSPPRPYVLSGDPGSGKSEIALEYAHRFASDYDVVWWIPAESHDRTRGALVELARLLGGAAAADPVAFLQEQLNEGVRYTSWLLVYDNVDDGPSSIDLLRPQSTASGHVIITTRAAGPGGATVGRFPRPDSIMLIRQFLDTLPIPGEDELLDLLDDVPLAVRLALACIKERIRFLQEMGEWRGRARSNALHQYLADYRRNRESSGDPVTTAVRLTLEQLTIKTLGPAIRRLLDVAAHLSPEGISPRLLYSRNLVALIAEEDSDLEDVLRLDQVLHIVARLELAAYNQAPGGMLRMHRLVQDVLRTEEARPGVQAVLAAYAPVDEQMSDADRRDRYTELQRHLGPAGAAEGTTDEVRRWLCGQVDHLWRSGDLHNWRIGRALASDLRARWLELFAQDDPVLMRLNGGLANLHRALGEHAESRRLNGETLQLQRRALLQFHPRTLITANSLAADLRMLGEFEDARAEDYSTYEGCLLTFGIDHPVTQSSANNLVISLILAGDLNEALRRELQNHSRRERLLGSSAIATCRSSRRLGDIYRYLGKMDESLRWLAEASSALRSRGESDHVESMRTDRSLAMTYRMTGEHQEDRGFLHQAAELSRITLSRLERAYGGDHVGTLACRLGHAGDLRLQGDHHRSLEHAEIAYEGYRRLYSAEHPFTLICRTDLALYLLTSERPDEAGEHAEAAYEGLRSRLADDHPMALAAALNHALCLSRDGEDGPAADLARLALRGLGETLGPDHPHTRIAAEAADGRHRGIDVEQPVY